MGNVIKNAVNSARNRTSESIENRAQILESKKPNIENFPTEISPTLLRQQQEARALEQIAKAEELKSQIKEIAIDRLKENASSLPGVSLLPSFPLQLPSIDPKVLAKLAVIKAMKKLEEEKNKISTENLSKGKEMFSFPLEDMYGEIKQ